jgi:NADPH:quinone reductase-like Zn-dependent oxidoreductase
MLNESRTIPKTMNAVVLHEYGDADQLKYEQVPVPKPGANELLVRVAAISLNPVDWKLRSGDLKKYMPLALPAILGRDVAGTVEAVGAEVAGFHVGDRVLGLVHHGYAEWVTSKGEYFALLPEGMSFETAASLPLVMLTGEQLIREAAAVQSGQTVLVTGALGGVGRSAVHTALKAGCRVLAGVRGAQKAKARTLGAADVVAIDDDDDLKRFAPYDVVADTVGHDVAQKLVALVRPGGVFASVLGDPPNAKERSDVRFAAMMAHSDPATLARMANDVQLGQFGIPIGRHFPLKDAALAQETAAQGGVGKVLLLP